MAQNNEEQKEIIHLNVNVKGIMIMTSNIVKLGNMIKIMDYCKKNKLKSKNK